MPIDPILNPFEANTFKVSGHHRKKMLWPQLFTHLPKNLYEKKYPWISERYVTRNRKI
jgi:hypothetical protein